jgi:SAM-dependent methyltransferase
MNTKDYFSGHSKLYATFRPTYPEELYGFIFSHVKAFECAWDCATGNGQVAKHLAIWFAAVEATDISQPQLDNAFKATNIHYQISAAESTPFTSHSFDLITVGQAIHWLNTEAFFREAVRVAKPGALLAVWGYNLCRVNNPIDTLVQEYYHHTVGKYWDPARKILESEYSSIEFPFEAISSPEFFIRVQWSYDEFAGYISTWSATQKFIREENYNPVPDLMKKITPYWNGNQEVVFPICLKTGILS